MPLIDLPAAWCRDVVNVLDTGATGREIRWTIDSAQDYESDFCYAFQNEVYPDIAAYLRGHQPRGCPKRMEKPPGETYEFFFTFKGRQAYGKVLLRPDHKNIVVFSAHLPRRPRLSCE
jgi:hypothetical protein